MATTKTLPANREFVDDGRNIRDAWLAVLQTLEPYLKISPASVADLITAAQDPSAAVETVNAFSSVSAFNDTIATDGGVIEALEAGDDLSFLVDGGGSIASDSVNRALSLSLGSHSSIIPGLGVHMAPSGFFSTSNGTASANRVYVSAIEFPSRRTITSFNWNKNDPGAAGSGTYAMALYYESTSIPGTPGIIALDAGQGTATRAAGSNGLQTLTVSMDLPGGKYWLMWTADSGYGALSHNNNAGSCAMGVDSSYNKITGYYRAATFPGNLSDETGSVWTADTSGNHPLVTITC